LTKTKAEREKEARLALEKELEALREKIRMTDIQTLSSLTRYPNLHHSPRVRAVVCGVCGVCGGVCGTHVVRFVATARRPRRGSVEIRGPA
jgi:ferredoxin